MDIYFHIFHAITKCYFNKEEKILSQAQSRPASAGHVISIVFTLGAAHKRRHQSRGRGGLPKDDLT